MIRRKWNPPRTAWLIGMVWVASVRMVAVANKEDGGENPVSRSLRVTTSKVKNLKRTAENWEELEETESIVPLCREVRTAERVDALRWAQGQAAAGTIADGQAVIRSAEEAEGTKGARKRKKFSIVRNKIGSMLMMVPLMMQLFSLPGALASIKMSLLKSIFVAKLALVVILINILNNFEKPTVRVLVQEAQHHQHYYHHANGHYRLEEDNDDTSWWRKK